MDGRTASARHCLFERRDPCLQVILLAALPVTLGVVLVNLACSMVQRTQRGYRQASLSLNVSRLAYLALGANSGLDSRCRLTTFVLELSLFVAAKNITKLG